MRLYNVMCQYLEGHYNSVDQCFLKDQCVLLQNHTLCERSIQYALWASGFSCNRAQKVHWRGFKFHIASNLLENYHSSNAGVISKKDTHNYLNTLPFSSYISVGGRFFSPIFQPKQCTATDWMQTQIWESGCVLLSQTLKRFAKM